MYHRRMQQVRRIVHQRRVHETQRRSARRRTASRCARSSTPSSDEAVRTRRAHRPRRRVGGGARSGPARSGTSGAPSPRACWLRWPHGRADDRPGPRRRPGALRGPVRAPVGMLLDQQFPMERAFAGPAKILERFGTLEPAAVAAAEPEAFADLCATPPAIHRYGRSMAGRIQALAVVVRDEYAGDAELALVHRHLRARARGPAQGAARLRRPEGPDLRGPARQAARRAPRRLGGGLRRLRRARLVPLGRRRRRPRLAAEGPRLQEGGQGRREGRA